MPGHDGEQIPLNVYFKKGAVKLNRRNRVLMEGYGAYGLNMHQGFNIVNLSAMERGWVIAQAMVRGDGARGIKWHEDGKKLNKFNSFKDFISCAEFLVANRITHPNLLAAKGTSAGGLLVAQACLNMRPDLFRACILDVPFLDVLTCLLDEKLPLTLTDHLEFGDPIRDEEIFKIISSFSPYDNLRHQEYPSTFLSMQLSDPRVPAWSTLKFIERMRDLAKEPKRFPNFGDKNFTVRINKQGGHFGSTENDLNLHNLVQEFAWLDFLLLNPSNDSGANEAEVELDRADRMR